MKTKISFKHLLAVTLAVVLLIGAVAIAADNSTISQKEIDAIINTTTDASQISSPFTAVSNKVRDSVVGINNYQIQRNSYYNYYGFGFGYGNRGNNNTNEEVLYAKGSGVVSLNGKMVDRPVVIRAERTIAYAIASGVLTEEEAI